MNQRTQTGRSAQPNVDPLPLSSAAISGVRHDPEYAQIFERFLAGQNQLGKLVPENTPQYQKIHAVMRDALAVLGFDHAEYRLHIQQSSVENAFVFPGVSPAPIFITTGLLAGLAKRYGEVSARHLAFLVGHESAHVRENAYVPLKTPDPVISRSHGIESHRSKGEQVGNIARLGILNRAGGREEENSCDSFGTLAVRRLGLPDTGPVEVLELFRDRAEERSRKTDRKPSLVADVLTTAVATHPASQRRIDKTIGQQRLLTLQRERGPATPREDTGLTPTEIKPICTPTELQQKMHSVCNSLLGAKNLNEASNLLLTAISSAPSHQELLHLVVIADLHSGYLRDDARYRTGANRGYMRFRDEMSEAAILRLDQIAAPQWNTEEREVIRGLMLKRLEEVVAAPESTPKPEKNEDRSDTADRSSSPLTTHTPCETLIREIEAIAKHGYAPIDPDAFPSSWLDAVSSSAHPTGLRLLDEQQIDIRHEIVKESFARKLSGLQSIEDGARCVAALAHGLGDLLPGDIALTKSVIKHIGKAPMLTQPTDVLPHDELVSRIKSVVADLPANGFAQYAALAPLAALFGRQRNLDGMAQVLATPLLKEAKDLLGSQFALWDMVCNEKELNAAVSRCSEVMYLLGCEAPRTSSAPDTTSESKIARKQATSIPYGDLPIYSKGFTRALEVVNIAGTHRGAVEIFPHFKPTHPDWQGIALTHYGPQEDNLIRDIQDPEKLPYTPNHGNAFRLLAIHAHDSEAAIDLLNITSDWLPKDQMVLKSLVDQISKLHDIAASNLDPDESSEGALHGTLSQYRNYGSPEKQPDLLNLARSRILPLLAEARPFVGATVAQQTERLESVSGAADELDRALGLLEDYERFQRLRFTPRSVRDQIDPTDLSDKAMLTLDGVVFMMGRALFDLNYRYGPKEEKERYQKMPPQEKLATIESHFVAASAEKDKHLVKLLEELGSSKQDLELKKSIHAALYSRVHAAHLGAEIYQSLCQHEPAELSQRLNSICLYLQQGTARYQEAIAELYDGGENGPPLVSGWSDHRYVQARLNREQEARREEGLYSGAGIDLIMRALQEDRVTPTECARALLWVAGLRDSCLLVECVELATDRRTRDLKKETDLLSTKEKEQILVEALAGKHGILHADPASRDLFLSALFIGVFKPLAQDQETLRECKAVFDTIMKLDSPERAARFLAACMVGRLNNLTEPEQIKLLFTSYGALGPKAAQQILARTDLFSAETRTALLDLTSRVPGGSCAELYAALERRYGEEVDLMFYDIRPVGGGSMQQVWEVRTWNKDHTGPGEAIICCKLRPGVVIDLAEDLRTTQGLADAMEAAPDLYGGAHLNRRAGRVIALQTALESHYPFLSQNQEGARGELESDRSANGKVRVTVPTVLSSLTYRSKSGASREVSLSDEEMMFMKRAEGETLDRYLESNPQDKGVVYETLARQMVRRMLRAGYVHADLHPGNIVVKKEENGSIAISLIDWGLSAKLPKLVSHGVSQLLQIAIGATDDNAPTIRTLFKSLVGSGQVSKDEGTNSMSDLVTLLGVAAGKRVTPSEAKTLGEDLYNRFNTANTPLNENIQSVETVLARAGVNLPLSLDYAFRGLATLTYVWKELGERSIWNIVRSELKDVRREAPQSKVNPAELKSTLAEIADLCGVPQIELEVTREKILSSKGSLAQAATVLRELAPQIEQQWPEGGISTFISDHPGILSKLGAAVGIPDLRGQLDEIYALDRQALSVGAEFRRPLRPLEEVREWCAANKIGELPEIWRAPIHPGTILRMRTPQGKGQLYITLRGPACESPGEIGIIPLESPLPSSVLNGIDRYLAEAVKKAESRSPDQQTGLASVITKPSQRKAVIEAMSSYDSFGMKIGHLLQSRENTIEYFDGEQWEDLRALRMI